MVDANDVLLQKRSRSNKLELAIRTSINQYENANSHLRGPSMRVLFHTSSHCCTVKVFLKDSGNDNAQMLLS